MPKLAPFECLGLDLTEATNGNYRGDCPFCGREEHFYVSQDTGKWDCKSCGERGNVYTFLTAMAKLAHETTPEAKWTALANNRGIPAEAFKNAGMGWSGWEWWIPAKNAKGTVVDIRRWDGKLQVMSTAGCHVHLYGSDKLEGASKSLGVWICEGEWDAICLRWLFDELGISDIVVGVPGALTFKQEWIDWFKGRSVVLCYDNDAAGLKGSKKAQELLTGVVKEMRTVAWTPAHPSGWDIRDTIKANRTRPRIAYKEILALLSTPSTPEKGTANGKASRAPSSGEKPIAFPDVIDEFKKWLKVDQDMIDAVAVSLAICLSSDIPGDPIWIYLVAPPGSGKTVVLMAMQASDRVKFFSTLTPASLVSGFDRKPDPSLLPKLNGMTAVFKDGTELLALNVDAKREVFGTLRGAFDGQVYKAFGNGVIRDYKLHFNAIVGITTAIHGDSQASMGERFLKFEMQEHAESVESKIRTAIGGLGKEDKMSEALSEACRRFLLREVNPESMPAIPEEYIEKILAVAQLLAFMRAQVDRETFGDRDVKYRPTHEIGTRIGKQLAKLGQFLCLVYGVPQVNEDVYRILYRIANDTSIGYNFDVAKALMREDNRPMLKEELARWAAMPSGNALYRRLCDMEQLQITERLPSITPPKVVGAPGQAKPHTGGPPASYWRLTPHVASLWRRARVQPEKLADPPQQPPKAVSKAASAPSHAPAAAAPALAKVASRLLIRQKPSGGSGEGSNGKH